MRANCVGTTITGQIDFRAYIVAKYDGLFPENYPTKDEYNKAASDIRMYPRMDEQHQLAQRRKARMDRIIKGFRKEWARQQRGN